MVPYYLINGFLTYIEFFDTRFEKYRLQKHKPKLNAREQPDLWWTIIKDIPVQHFSIMGLLLVVTYLLQKTGMQVLESPPNIFYMLFHISIFIFFEEFFFYWTHYALHTKWLFKKVHYVHHKFYQPIGWVANNAHWVV